MVVNFCTFFRSQLCFCVCVCFFLFFLHFISFCVDFVFAAGVVVVFVVGIILRLTVKRMSGKFVA